MPTPHHHFTGLFVENGPFQVTEDLQLYPNPYTWNKKYGMIFFDNPVGMPHEQ